MVDHLGLTNSKVTYATSNGTRSTMNLRPPALTAARQRWWSGKA